ncbi:hypothetical protein BDV25DRAFT_147681 [Aspergillus avenaceus]|uniref:PrpF protein-domain-containing protein n=1 Tax=Aspergillus avenaceus TaxID=36643 RepID=A0A5N6U6Z5_ASPAV|nr:hypothetical protein BDV25DRAFT_147681 [Aspergillus avenaceus]
MFNTFRQIDIKVFNTNTQQCLVETIQITPDGKFSEDGEYSIPGVRGTASPIRMSFLSPCGSVTGRLLPSGAKQELLTVSSARSRTPFMVRASLVDAANPFIFIDAATMPPLYHHAGVGSSISLEIIEEIRVAGAVRLGLAKDIAAASRTRGTPKIALLYPTTRPEATGISHNHADIEVRAFSLGKPHPSFQLTGAVCLGVALSTPGTVAWELWKQGGPGSSNFYPSLPQKTEPDTLKWLIKHPSGVMDAEVKLSLGDDGDRVVERVSVFRTARRLFEGRVFYRL